jgi:hypothetical protein
MLLKVAPPRPVDRHRMAPAAELAGNDTKGHRHPVDFGGECLSDNREFHGMRGLRIPLCTPRVTVACRTCYVLDKSEMGALSGTATHW